MEPKRNMYWVPIVMASCLALGLYMGNLLTPQQEGSLNAGEARFEKIQEVIQILDQRYVDSLDGDDVFEQMIGEMLHRLDPHSNYIPAEELSAMNEMIEGKFGGIGIRFFIIRDTVCVTNVISGSPSERVGLKAGDKIVKIDGKKVAGKRLCNDDLMGMLKGVEGTDVEVTVLRNKKYLTKRIERGTIPVESISAAYMLTKDIGFIRIDQFSVMTATEFRVASAELKSHGMKKLIIDLRDNGGGILTGATEIADEFLGANVPIVETRGVHSAKHVYRATSGGSLQNVKVAILMNSNSASASEILAGAIQDNDRGTIIGRRSFGKGLVQEDYMLNDGSNLRLTVARYYTPTGRCIQKPYSEDYESYYEDHAERYDNGELYAMDSTVFVDSLRFVTPGGRVVYGGGGIMPDIFVPYDSSGASWYLTELRYSTAFNTFAFDFVSGKRSNWKSAKDFNARFTVSDELLNRFARYAEKYHGVKRNEAELRRSKRLISKFLKAEIARQIWLEEGFFQVLNTSDVDVQRALKELR